jgi:hypothetical protein
MFPIGNIHGIKENEGSKVPVRELLVTELDRSGRDTRTRDLASAVQRPMRSDGPKAASSTPIAKTRWAKSSKCESIDLIVGADIKSVVGCDQGLEMVQARHRFIRAPASEQGLACVSLKGVQAVVAFMIDLTCETGGARRGDDYALSFSPRGEKPADDRPRKERAQRRSVSMLSLRAARSPRGNFRRRSGYNEKLIKRRPRGWFVSRIQVASA